MKKLVFIFALICLCCLCYGDSLMTTSIPDPHTLPISDASLVSDSISKVDVNTVVYQPEFVWEENDSEREWNVGEELRILVWD